MYVYLQRKNNFFFLCLYQYFSTMLPEDTVSRLRILFFLFFPHHNIVRPEGGLNVVVTVRDKDLKSKRVKIIVKQKSTTFQFNFYIIKKKTNNFYDFIFHQVNDDDVLFFKL